MTRITLTALIASSVMLSVPAFADDWEENWDSNETEQQPHHSDEWDNSTGREGRTGNTDVASSGNLFGTCFSIEGFYGASAEDDGVDIYGLNLRSTIALQDKGPIIPEFFILAGLGYGSDESSYTEPYWVPGSWTSPGHWGYTTVNNETEVMQVELSLGLDVRFVLSEHVSFYVGGRGGFCSISIDTEFSGESNSESDTGFVYGGGVGIDFALSENIRLAFEYNYLEYKYSDADDPAKYNMLSGGLKINF